MSVFKYFKPALPSPAQTGVGDSITTTANKEVEKITGPPTRRKTKQYATYTDEDRGRIGRCAAENGTIVVFEHFKSEHKDLEKSTVHCKIFEEKYLAAVTEKHMAQNCTEVLAIPSLK